MTEDAFALLIVSCLPAPRVQLRSGTFVTCFHCDHKYFVCWAVETKITESGETVDIDVKEKKPGKAKGKRKKGKKSKYV